MKNTFIEEMLALPKTERDRMKKELNTVPVDLEMSATFCDVLKCRLLSPCRLEKCPYNIPDRSNLNCIKQLKANDKKKPTQAAIATSLRMGLEEMREVSNSAMSKLRRASLRERLHEDEANRFSYITNTKVCVGCASSVESESHKHEIADGHHVYYCSRGCESRRPIAQIRLEIEYQTDIGEILLTARKLFKKLDTIQTTLGVRKTALLQWYDTLLGVRPHEFGHDAAASVDVLRKSVGVAPEDSFVSLLSVEKSHRWWVEYDAKIQSALLSI